MTILPLLVICLALGTNSQSSVFNRVTLTQSDAICLDNSKGSYYISEGSGANAKSFLIQFQGGELCGKLDIASSLESCVKMSESQEGSSKHYPATKNFTNHSILSGDPAINPNFYDWTRILLMHCDGSGHQGSLYLGLSYRTKVIHLRGQNITKGMFATLNETHNIFVDADRIVLAGSAVGGIAALQWANYVKENGAAPVYAIADAAAYIDAVNVNTNRNDYRTSVISTLKLCSVNAMPPLDDCVYDFYDDYYGFWKCMFPETIINYLKVPAFITTSLYDSWALKEIVGIKCLNGTKSLSNCNAAQVANIEKYKQNVTGMLQTLSKTPNTGIWAPSCVFSSTLNTTIPISEDYRVPEGSPYSASYSIGQWLKNPSASIVQIDSNSWPFNKACSK